MMHTMFIYVMHVIREIPQIVPKLYIIVKYFGCVTQPLGQKAPKDTFNSNFCCYDLILLCLRSLFSNY